MKAKLDKEGFLHVERGGEYKLMGCPLTTMPLSYNAGSRSCGDWCPLFEEPHHTQEEDCAYTVIHLCHYKHLCFDTFTDEREASKC